MEVAAVAEVLDETEIDALLAILGSGGAELDQEPAPPARPAGTPPGPAVQVYDFRRPERVSNDRLRALEALHEGFARDLGASLSGYLRTIVEVSVSQVQQTAYGDYIHSLPDPTCFNLLCAEQLAGAFCLEISPLIVYPVIDRLLGGSNADLFIPQRPLTQIEVRLVQRITDRCAHHLSESWSTLAPLSFRAEGTASSPQRIQILPPNETVVVVIFEVKMGQRGGTMTLCIPYRTIEPIVARLGRQPWDNPEPRGGGNSEQEKLAQSLGNAPLELRAVLARTTITLEELVSLAPGDLLTTEKPASTPAVITIEGRPKFQGILGQLRGNKAVRLTRVLRQSGAASPPGPPPDGAI